MENPLVNKPLTFIASSQVATWDRSGSVHNSSACPGSVHNSSPAVGENPGTALYVVGSENSGPLSSSSETSSRTAQLLCTPHNPGITQVKGVFNTTPTNNHSPINQQTTPPCNQ
jgi:hypothetical protein